MYYSVNGEKLELKNGGILLDQDGVQYAVPKSFTEKFLIPVDNEFEQQYIASLIEFTGEELQTQEDWSHLLND
ncbi:hypothetical protein [Psychrobacillus phage Perkons]|nr:hypothetical protein [Psychrobacillus phage Perkons]